MREGLTLAGAEALTVIGPMIDSAVPGRHHPFGARRIRLTRAVCHIPCQNAERIVAERDQAPGWTSRCQ
jgi:hypothetical protein